MDFYGVIRNRRSCRIFTPDPVPRDVLERVVEAALWAPSGKNRQNWRIFVVTGGKREELVGIAERSFPLLEPSLRKLYDEKIVAFTRNFFKTLGGAPVLLVFYSQPTEEGLFVDTQSVSAAIENALLAATHEGLGACWMTNPVHLEDEVDEALGVEGMNLIAFVPMGYPGKEPPVPPRKEGRVSWIGFE
ncbi:5,6-dimethylbenzimidazole synthase [bacterium BMS3Abin14]|nr:5,6-dimethylbenzimidazole synthase [bacterium BMS3Abin14]